MESIFERVAATKAKNTTDKIIWAFWDKWVRSEGGNDTTETLEIAMFSGLVKPHYYICDDEGNFETYEAEEIEQAITETGMLRDHYDNDPIQGWEDKLITSYSFTQKAHEIYLKHNAIRLAAYNTYKPPFSYDEHSQSVWDERGEMVLDVRGWGHIQKQDNGAAVQDEIGKIIVDALDFYWSIHA